MSRLSLWMGAILLASGCLHLAFMLIQGLSWQGPISIRKPILFGISGGLTVWSLTWLMTQLRPWRYDRAVILSISISLLVEVFLISFQYWRGVPSHFNRNTSFDSAIESMMLLLILLAVVLICYLTWRTVWLEDRVRPAMAIAIRAGMGLLTISCMLGIATTLLGYWNLDSGRTPETWGKAGVLKFPHGIALHAIQLLPAVVWFTERVLPRCNPVRVVWYLLGSQCVMMLYSIRQTGLGLARFEVDAIGVVLLGITILIAVAPILEIVRSKPIPRDS
jgi:hypothetical protein